MARKTKAPAPPAAQPPLVFPSPLIPLRVLGAWMERNWSKLAGSSRYVVEHGFVFERGKYSTGENFSFTLGRLPAGWDAVYLAHDGLGAEGYFVGPAWACKQATAMDRRVFKAADTLADLLHGPEDDGG